LFIQPSSTSEGTIASKLLPDCGKFRKKTSMFCVKIIYVEKLERNINRNSDKFSIAILFSQTATFLESSRGHGYLTILSMEKEDPY
jgi:hypothetical protein